MSTPIHRGSNIKVHPEKPLPRYARSTQRLHLESSTEPEHRQGTQRSTWFRSVTNRCPLQHRPTTTRSTRLPEVFSLSSQVLPSTRCHLPRSRYRLSLFRQPIASLPIQYMFLEMASLIATQDHHRTRTCRLRPQPTYIHSRQFGFLRQLMLCSPTTSQALLIRRQYCFRRTVLQIQVLRLAAHTLVFPLLPLLPLSRLDQ
jgi:hypothetical protein